MRGVYRWSSSSRSSSRTGDLWISVQGGPKKSLLHGVMGLNVPGQAFSSFFPVTVDYPVEERSLYHNGGRFMIESARNQDTLISQQVSGQQKAHVPCLAASQVPDDD